MNKHFKASRTRLHKYLVGELNCTLTAQNEQSWYYKSSSLDLTIRISDHLSTRKEDILDIVFIKQSTSNILVHFKNSVSLVKNFIELKATIRAADTLAIGMRSMNSCKAELASLEQTVSLLSQKIQIPESEDCINLHKLTKAQRTQVEKFIEQNSKDFYE